MVSISRRWRQLNEFVAILGRVPALAHLHGDELAPLAAAARRREVEAGEVLVHRGQVSRTCFVVTTGEVAVRPSADLETVHSAGEIVGVGTGWDGSAEVVALTDGDVLALEAGEVADAVARSSLHLDRAVDTIQREGVA